MPDALKLGALSANISSQEPIDVVMHESYEENATLWDHFTQTKFVPFNPTDKYTIATITPKDGGAPFRLMKGAPQVSCPANVLRASSHPRTQVSALLTLPMPNTLQREQGLQEHPPALRR